MGMSLGGHGWLMRIGAVPEASLHIATYPNGGTEQSLKAMENVHFRIPAGRIHCANHA